MTSKAPTRMRRAWSPPLPISVDRADHVPLHQQIYDQLRDLILAGRLAPGQRLPASRAFAQDLGVSRNTVLGAFDQLLAEGYLEGTGGSGTFVCSVLPEDLLSAAPSTDQPASRQARRRGLSGRGKRLAGVALGRPRRNPAFSPGLPAFDAFPTALWARLMGSTWRAPSIELLAAEDPAGFRPLRRAIADYLRAARAVRCDEHQVIIVSGAQQAIDLSARALLDAGDVAIVEEPGYQGVRGALVGAGATLAAIPVDEEGIRVDLADHLAPEARLACVAPSHQYPLGMTMSLARRLQLLEWAVRRDCWVLEDDYDSEYRYAGRPVPSLQGLESEVGGRRVIYLASFSKVLFPSLRLGYLVVPPDLVEPMLRVRSVLDDHPAPAAQPALARFIEGGHFSRHLRRMRRLYAARQAAMVAAAERHLAGLLTVTPDPVGMHLVGYLTPQLRARMDDVEASRRAAAAGLTAPAISRHYQDSPDRQGLMLGFAAVSEARMDREIKRLAAALR